MSRWLRALIIALLIPCYGLAAAGVAVFAQSASGDEQVATLGQGAGLNVDLASEMDDTSDDAAELPTTAVAAPAATPVPSQVFSAPDSRPPANATAPLLRPPKSAVLLRA
jgi:hypothetical protein